MEKIIAVSTACFFTKSTASQHLNTYQPETLQPSDMKCVSVSFVG